MKNILHENEIKLIGQVIPLTENLQYNMSTVREFWKTFNRNLRNANIFLPKQWVKYGITIRENGKLYYVCAVPFCGYVPDDFKELSLKESDYLYMEHIGGLQTLLDTYRQLHNDAELQQNFELKDDHLVYFERYTTRFQWNSMGSVIEIWIPIEKEEEYANIS